MRLLGPLTTHGPHALPDLSFRPYLRLLLPDVDNETGSSGPNATTSASGTCLRCGAAWVGRPGGRPRKWCSQLCRRAAYEERRAAAAGAIAVREVVRETRAGEHDLSTCAARVVDSPAACRRVLRSLDKLVSARSDPQWSSIRDELLKLAAKIKASDDAATRWRRW